MLKRGLAAATSSSSRSRRPWARSRPVPVGSRLCLRAGHGTGTAASLRRFPRSDSVLSRCAKLLCRRGVLCRRTSSWRPSTAGQRCACRYYWRVAIRLGWLVKLNLPSSIRFPNSNQLITLTLLPTCVVSSTLFPFGLCCGFYMLA